jgi:hypothetical protein
MQEKKGKWSEWFSNEGNTIDESPLGFIGSRETLCQVQYRDGEISSGLVKHYAFSMMLIDSDIMKYSYWIPDEDESTPETMTQDKGTKGVKNDSGKTRWSYLPLQSIKSVIDVMTYGDKKYPAEDGSNWKRVKNARKRYYNATMRHLTSWFDGEKNDPESGLHHLAHACSNILFLLWFEFNGYPEDKE